MWRRSALAVGSTLAVSSVVACDRQPPHHAGQKRFKHGFPELRPIFPQRAVLCEETGSSKSSKTRCLVYLGANPGKRPEYSEAAAQLGSLLAERGYLLVYGGGGKGLMGILADAAMESGGEVHGVMPEDLVKREWAHIGITRLDVVHSLSERKDRMLSLADFVIAVPGGLGTFEEMLEAMSRGQLGYHEKILGFLNTCGYYDNFMVMFRASVDEGFVREDFLERVVIGRTPEELLDKMAAAAEAAKARKTAKA